MRRFLCALVALVLAAAPAHAQAAFGLLAKNAAVQAQATATAALAQQASGNTMPNVYNRTPQTLKNLTTCLAKMRVPASTQHCLVLGGGDSKFAGNGAGTGSDASGAKNVGAAGRNLTYQMALAFADRGYAVQRQSACGTAGYATITAIQGYDPRRTVGSNYVFSGPFAIGGILMYLNSPYTDTQTFTPDATAYVDSFTEWANSGTTGQSGTGGGGFSQFTISDGTTSGTFNGSQASPLVRKFTQTFASRATGKTITVARVNNNSGQFMPICAMASDSTVAAIDLINLGHSGVTTGNLQGTETYSARNAIPAMAPVAVIFQLFTNDISNSITDATIVSNYQILWTAAKTTGDCIVLLPTKPPSTQTTPYARYPATALAVKTAAIAAGCMVIDLGGRFGDWATANSLGLEDDTVPHETPAGYAHEARAIVDAMVL